MRRSPRAVIIGLVAALLSAGCGSASDLADERSEAVARTCHSILERRVDGEIDWETVEGKAGAEAIAAAYTADDGRHRTTSALIRGRCRLPDSP